MEQMNLLEEGVAKTIRRSLDPTVKPCPISYVPALVRLQSSVEDGKTDWITGACPAYRGFYEVVVLREDWECQYWIVPYCWWDPDTGLWWNSRGEVEPGVVRYRGVVESVGRKRRVLLAA